MRDLDLKTLRLLVTVCDLQNIKAAAEQEHIEPSAISKRIAQLEAALGTEVLVRTRRGVQPTPAGLAVVEHARTLLFTVERLASDVSAYGGGLKGHVRLLASASAIAESLLDDVAAFMGQEANQAIRVDIEERTSREVVRAIREGSASIGVCWDNVGFDDLEIIGYRSDELALVVPRAHPLAARRTVGFVETLAFDQVGLGPTTAMHGMLQRAASRAGETVRYRVLVSNFDAALRVVAAGLAVSVIPAQICASHARAPVAAVPLTDPWARRQFAVCFRRRDSLQPAAARLLAFLEQQVRPALA